MKFEEMLLNESDKATDDLAIEIMKRKNVHKKSDTENLPKIHAWLM